MINYIGKFLLVIFDIKKKPLCEERLLFYVSGVPLASVRNLFGVESWTCSRKGMFATSAVPKQLHRLGTTVSSA